MVSKIGFFISPEGKVIPVEKHIKTVTQDPESFGLSTDYVDSVYERHRETRGLEGDAREKILREVMKRGWIRIRRYTNEYWSIQTGTMTDGKKGAIRQWAQQILDGQGEYEEEDPYMPVRIVGLEDGFRQKTTIQKLSGRFENV